MEMRLQNSFPYREQPYRKRLTHYKITDMRLMPLPNKGYCLSSHTDILSTHEIRKYLNWEYAYLHIVVLNEGTSTNSFVRENAVAGAMEGHVVVGNTQTAGYGRVGRSFFPSLCDDAKNHLTAKFLNRFMRYYST